MDERIVNHGTSRKQMERSVRKNGHFANGSQMRNQRRIYWMFNSNVDERIFEGY
jgi:hypothetical protein